MALSPNEADILEKIVGFGGYITKEMLSLYRSDIGDRRCKYILKSLEEKNYIKKRGYFISHRQPDVYQVTKKACSYYGRPEAYMRKKHKPFAVRRYLLRSHYLFMLSGQGVKVSLYTTGDRAVFLKGMGFTEYHMPKKNDKTQIDEFIIDDERHTRGRAVTFLYIDNPDDNAGRQLKLLIEKYRLMQSAQAAFLNFIIVSESKLKADAYMAEYNEKFFRRVSMIDVKALSIDRNYQAMLRLS